MLCEFADANKAPRSRTNESPCDTKTKSSGQQENNRQRWRRFLLGLSLVPSSLESRVIFRARVCQPACENSADHHKAGESPQIADTKYPFAKLCLLPHTLSLIL